ncbi:MAG: hypothetical protein HGA96_15080 [Desulfobulbaceae bacterium]|nr:hypothetical protein [Desulfobulbaceae bacterium]
MKKLHYGLIGLGMLLCTATAAPAQVSFSIGFPHVSIGINLPLFPDLVRVPGYPVYYAPGVEGNYFFYDGSYWVFQDDNWYASYWYNGPWEFVAPEDVPLFVLRVPVSYYRIHPVYFRGWLSNEPPRWGDHWGHEWEHHRSGWNQWDRHSVPAPAPLPVYQRKFAGDRYPQPEQQQTLQRKNYRYEPRDPAVQQRSQRQVEQAPAPAQRAKQNEPAVRTPREQDTQRQPPPRQDAPTVPKAQSSPPGHKNTPRPTPAQAPHEQRGQATEQRQLAPPARAPQEQRGSAREQRQQPETAQPQQQAPTAQGQGQRSPAREESARPARERGQGQGQNKDAEEERGRGRNR